MDMDTIGPLMAASEKLEMDIAALYSIFSRSLPEDSEFWEQLCFEEKNHAALIASIRETFVPLSMEFPVTIVAESLTELERANKVVAGHLATFQEAPPDREKIFNTALELELSAGEIHFQCFMKNPPATVLEEMFQQLNLEDKDHSLRLHAYMKEQGIPFNRKNVSPV